MGYLEKNVLFAYMENMLNREKDLKLSKSRLILNQHENVLGSFISILDRMDWDELKNISSYRPFKMGRRKNWPIIHSDCVCTVYLSGRAWCCPQSCRVSWWRCTCRPPRPPPQSFWSGAACSPCSPPAPPLCGTFRCNTTQFIPTSLEYKLNIKYNKKQLTSMIIVFCFVFLQKNCYLDPR